MKLYDNTKISKKIKRKQRIGKFFKCIFYPIIALLFISSIIVLAQKIQNPKKNPSLFGYKVFVIASGSMEPTLNIGDIVIIHEVEVNDIVEGDIITFQEGDSQTVTHRVVNIIDEDSKIKYETKGDNNNTVDEGFVYYDDVEGKYLFKINRIGTTVLKAQNIVVMIVIIIILYFIYKIMQRKDEKNFIRHEKRKKFEENDKD